VARIELKGIAKGWGEVRAVDGVDLDIADEEFVVFLGPSGCGKTTTMRMIAGLSEPTEGEIRIDGELVNGIDARDRDVAMVFQSYALYPNMTIYENIRFPLRMRGVARSEHDRLVRQAADLVELGAYLERKPGALSGGQRQRAALARAIVRHPRVFLMDEPLSNLDAKLRNTMRIQLKYVQRQLKITTVYVTHDQVEAMTLADRIVIMSGGRIQQIGTPDQIYSDPANTFVAGFIGSPPMNLIGGVVENGRFLAPGIDAASDGLPDRAGVVLGVRPEDVRVAGEAAGADAAGSLYGLEPTGDQTYLSVRTGAGLIEVKAARDFRQALDTPIHLSFDRRRLFLFDRESGERIRRA
jgi:multiple sugar transport system ATP-binding protein